MTISETTTNAVANPGVLSTNPPNIIIALRAPTVNDTNANIGDEWCNKITNPYTFYKLAFLFGGQAIWMPFLAPNQINFINVDASTPPGTNPVVPLSGNITITGGQVAAGTTANVIRTDSLAANTFTIEIQRSEAVAATDITKNGVSHFNSSEFTVDANGFVGLVGGGAAIETLTDDVGTTITPTAGNIQLVGHVVEQGATKFSTVVAGTHLANINPMSSARWIVDSLGFNGTHTTIAAAITSSTSGDTILILPGTYTENLTLKAGVNLTAQSGDQLTPNVVISGKCTFTAAGTVTISNIQLQTNSDYLLSVTGAVASIVNLNNCYINCTNNTGINFTSSAGLVNLQDCFGNLGTTGIAYFASSGAGGIQFFNCQLSNTGSSLTASTASAGTIINFNSNIVSGLTLSGGATALMYACSLGGSLTLVTGGGANITCFQVRMGNVVIGAGTSVFLEFCSINTIAANAIAGTGNLSYSDISFVGASSTIQNTLSITQEIIALGTVEAGIWQGSVITGQYGGTGVANTGLTINLGSGATDKVLSSDSSGNGTWKLPTALSVPYTNVNSSPYTVLATDYYLSVDCSGGAITLNFPNAPTATQRWIVKDRTGSAHTHNITATTPGGIVTFDGATSYVLSTNYQAIDLIANATPTYEVF